MSDCSVSGVRDANSNDEISVVGLENVNGTEGREPDGGFIAWSLKIWTKIGESVCATRWNMRMNK